MIAHENQNRWGRPDNWADRTVEELLHAHALAGALGSQSEWLEIIERDKPKQVDAIVAQGRFRAILAEGGD